MIDVPEIEVCEIRVARGDGRQSLVDLAQEAVRALEAGREIGGVIGATFSNPRRFPSLAVKVAAEIGLPCLAPAFDIQMACSAYPYAVYLAGKISADIGKSILVVNGDVQSRLVDASDHATGKIFSDAVTASVIGTASDASRRSRFEFYSRYDEALVCEESGPIRMDGFKVFSFVATEVSQMLRKFGDDFEWFAPHQANPYMVRQLAKSLGVEGKLLALDERMLNPGSCSVPMTIAANGRKGRTLIAGFGAGLSASAGIVRVV